MLRLLPEKAWLCACPFSPLPSYTSASMSPAGQKRPPESWRKTTSPPGRIFAQAGSGAGRTSPVGWRPGGCAAARFPSAAPRLALVSGCLRRPYCPLSPFTHSAKEPSDLRKKQAPPAPRGLRAGRGAGQRHGGAERGTGAGRDVSAAGPASRATWMPPGRYATSLGLCGATVIGTAPARMSPGCTA